MSVWKLRRAVAVVYPSLNITNHQSLSKKKTGSIREEFYIEACSSGHYQPKALRRACALTIESTFYRERKGFISREKRFVLTIKNIGDGFWW